MPPAHHATRTRQLAGQQPTGPGLGIELDENALAAKINHDWRNPEAYDPDDSSVVDW